MSLLEYTACGFPGSWDQAIAVTPVVGIDRELVQTAVRLCEATAEVLYSPAFSPCSIRYQKGARPQLEAIARSLCGETARERASSAMEWVSQNVHHPHLTGPLAADRGLTEEALLASARGWCNEQVRVFIALCAVMEIPARVCFLFHANNVCGHTAAEAFVDGAWAFHDVTFNLTVPLPNGQLASARDIWRESRELAHWAYREPLRRYYGGCLPFAESAPGWNQRDRPEVERGGDLLACVGIANYLIEGVQSAVESQ